MKSDRVRRRFLQVSATVRAAATLGGCTADTGAPPASIAATTPTPGKRTTPPIGNTVEDKEKTMKSPLTNCNVRPRLPVERSYVYQPLYTWTYSHHQSITYYKERFYAIWSNGRVNEDDPGQRVLISSSPDAMHWVEPQPLIGPLQGDHSEVVLTASGFHQYNGTLAAYVGQYEYTAEAIKAGIKGGQGHQDTRLFAMTAAVGATLLTWASPSCPTTAHSQRAPAV